MQEALTGRRIVVPETRELDLFVTMLRERGAEPIACPMIAINDAPDPVPVAQWLRRFVADPCDDLILLTGEGLRRLVGLADRLGVKASFVAALGGSRMITRGPKPVRALREIGLDAGIAATVPTSKGVIDALAGLDLSQRRVGVQLYPDGDHQALLDFLAGAGARVDPVLPYVYSSAADDARVLAVIDRMAAGTIDAVAFTSSPQVRRFHQVAAEAGRAGAAKAGLARIIVAAVGPVVAQALATYDVRVDVVPANDTYFMKPLVRALAAAFAAPPTGGPPPPTP
jgi:uroporphyrinogen-III synthase